MIRVSMSDNRQVYRLPGINMETSGRTVEAALSVLQQHGERIFPNSAARSNCRDGSGCVQKQRINMKDTLAWLDGVSPHLPRFLSKVGRDSVEPNSREAEIVYLRSVVLFASPLSE